MGRGAVRHVDGTGGEARREGNDNGHNSAPPATAEGAGGLRAHQLTTGPGSSMGHPVCTVAPPPPRARRLPALLPAGPSAAVAKEWVVHMGAAREHRAGSACGRSAHATCQPAEPSARPETRRCEQMKGTFKNFDVVDL